MIKYKRFLILFSFLFAGAGDVKAVKENEMKAYKMETSAQKVVENQMKMRTASHVGSANAVGSLQGEDMQKEDKDAAVSEASSAEVQARNQGVSGAEITMEAARSSVSEAAQSMRQMVQSTRS
ncbi:MAG: hypothetical protein B7Y25_05285 [Alphaproteobacteria bacterium 16-39-46]|nr:MAG: hypothetical protein B7Y25_05285 [Alphaproteobacteria bacterium 16-39-46]OZA42729.1 MAG: hypothetical protein B7X84_05185 [Alphaproteobacteria bacterium 17-39-52]HQS83633.1 hypothetical protein [Alphaproteobacteria bacterium]HQS93374.1 hypothetical protein [Alphaproteobacteria bacterium]